MEHLLKPLKAGNLELANRLVMPPMATEKSEDGGKVSQKLIDYYTEKSRGGYISLVIIEHSFVRPDGKASEGQLSVADDSVIEGLRKLAKAIQENGSKAVMQISHAGSATTEGITGSVPLGPTAISNPRKKTTPRELSIEEISDIIEAFLSAARRTKEAGFNGVEIHSAHGFLLNQFFSPLTNRRTDQYGKDVLKRIRIHLQIIEAIKKAAGEDFPLLLRLGASDFMPGGTTIEDSIAAAREFEKAGVDILDISGGFSGYTVPGLSGQGFFSPLSEAIKEAVSIPVILTGGITRAEAAESLLKEGKADLIGVGRAILNDSDWAKRAITGLQHG
ncbi:MAG: NADH:flavin oxidoreductase [Bacillota bacterium]